jgi:hypothetical protein
MTQEKDPRAERPQRIASLETLKYFWDLMARHYPGLYIDLSLFNYKTGQFNRPEVKEGYGVRRKVPVEKAYENVIDFLEDYYAGKDILWKPSEYYKKHKDALVSLVWVDDFKLDNKYNLSPLFYLQTSPDKYQAFFKLKTPATPDEITAIQQKLARLLGDKGGVSFYQHRRMPGLCNGKYEDDPVVILFLNDNPTLLDIKDIQALGEGEGGVTGKTFVVVNKGQGTEGQPEEQRTEGQPRVKGFYVRPVVPANYMPVLCKPREDFIKRRENGTIDQSATDMAWATHFARIMSNGGWDDAAIAFTIYDILIQNSPEVAERKKTPKHLRQYLFRTIWKAIDKVKKTPPEPPRDEEGTPEKEPSDV